MRHMIDNNSTGKLELTLNKYNNIHQLNNVKSHATYIGIKNLV